MINKCSIILLIFLLQVFIHAGSKQLTVQLSLPGEPGSLEISHVSGRIKVTGYSGDVVIVQAGTRVQDETDLSSGMRKVPEQSIQLNVSEKNNQVIIATNSDKKTIDLDLYVPRNFDLYINNADNGEIEIIGVDGELVLNNIRDDIILTNVFGPAVISTVYGKIKAGFRENVPDRPMAFSTLSGKIEIILPFQTSALLKMKSEFGQIYTDFPLELLEGEIHLEKSKKTGVSQIAGDDWIYARINGGGAQILLSSYHGDIIVQQRKKQESD
jgi:hypothetical protein